MSQNITVPARFHQVHDDADAIYVANQYRGPSFYAEEVILPNSGNGFEPVLNFELSIEEGSANDVRKALEDALTWFHHIESQLPGGTELNR